MDRETVLTRAPEPRPASPASWPVWGIRVQGDTVIIKVKGGNEAARWLCGQLLAMFKPGA